MSHVYKYILLIAALCVLNSCATAAQPGGMVPQSTAFRSESFDATLRRAITITKVGGGEKTNPLLGSKVGDDEMREALHLSLEQYDLYASSEASASFSLEAFLIELKQPVSGYTMVVSSVVRYKLIRNSDNRALYDDIVTASYRATLKDSSIGINRLKLANEGSIRANITSFLDRLRSVEAAKGPGQ